MSQALPLALYVVGALVFLVLAAWAWIAVLGWVAERDRATRFRRHRGALEALLRDPAGKVVDPALRAAGILSYEREGDRTYFAAELLEDNGRTPDRLHGYLHAPSGPPGIGAPTPRSTGRYNEGANPFRITRLARLEGEWWSYTCDELWKQP